MKLIELQRNFMERNVRYLDGRFDGKNIQTGANEC